MFDSKDIEGRKKKIIHITVKYVIIIVIAFIALFYITMRYLPYSLENVKWMLGGILLIFLSIIILPYTYMCYKYGLILISPWNHLLHGGNSSWWIDSEVETDLFWRLTIMSVVIFTVTLFFGFFLIFMALYIL